MESGDTITDVNMMPVKQAHIKEAEILGCGLTIIGCIWLLLKSVVFSYMLTFVLIIILVCDIYLLTTGYIRRLNNNFLPSNDKQGITTNLLDPITPRDMLVIIDVLETTTKRHIIQLKAYSQQDQEFSTSTHFYDTYAHDDPIDIQKAPLQPFFSDGKAVNSHDPYSMPDKFLIKGDQAIEDHKKAAREQGDHLTTDSCEELVQQSLATEFGSGPILKLSPIQYVKVLTDSVFRGDNPPRISEDSTEDSTHSSSLSLSDEDNESYVKSKPPDTLPASDHSTSMPSSQSRVESQMIFEIPCSSNSVNSSKSQPAGIAERHLQSLQTSLALPTEESCSLPLDLTSCKDDSCTLLPPSSFEHQSTVPQGWLFSQNLGTLPTFNELTEDNYGIPHLNSVENSLSPQDQLVRLILHLSLIFQLLTGIEFGCWCIGVDAILK